MESQPAPADRGWIQKLAGKRPKSLVVNQVDHYQGQKVSLWAVPSGRLSGGIHTRGPCHKKRAFDHLPHAEDTKTKKDSPCLSFSMPPRILIL